MQSVPITNNMLEDNLENVNIRGQELPKLTETI